MKRRIVCTPRAGRFIMRRNDRLNDLRVNVRLPVQVRFSRQYGLFAYPAVQVQ